MVVQRANHEIHARSHTDADERGHGDDGHRCLPG